jgi:surfeit locus 1 family protein
MVVTVIFAALTIRLGNWQGDRAEYKIGQQAQLDAALAAPPLDVADVLVNANPAVSLRYRSISLQGQFVANELFFVDNRIVDSKAGYGLVQSFRLTAPTGANRTILVERGWLTASTDRNVLPAVETPGGLVQISGRINVPPSRNPGTFDNDGGKRLNYLNIAELSQRLNRPLELFVVEQTGGPGFTGTVRPAPGANFEKNRAYQVQWYAFAALAVIIFFVLSFRKVDAT